jgi:hypothetical protein
MRAFADGLPRPVRDAPWTRPFPGPSTSGAKRCEHTAFLRSPTYANVHARVRGSATGFAGSLVRNSRDSMSPRVTSGAARPSIFDIDNARRAWFSLIASAPVGDLRTRSHTKARLKAQPLGALWVYDCLGFLRRRITTSMPATSVPGGGAGKRANWMSGTGTSMSAPLAKS